MGNITVTTKTVQSVADEPSEYEMRKCRVCGGIFPLSTHFYRRYRNGNVYHNYCKSCARQMTKRWAVRTAEQEIEHNMSQTTRMSEHQAKLGVAYLSDESLIEEIQRRGYEGELRKVRRISV